MRGRDQDAKYQRLYKTPFFIVSKTNLWTHIAHDLNHGYMRGREQDAKYQRLYKTPFFYSEQNKLLKS
jgi:hypothetical protein